MVMDNNSDKRPLVVADCHVPLLKELLGDSARLVMLPAGEITARAVRDADALITRTRTRCDATLLGGSRCRVVATATIGTDHIDIPWCRAHGIEVASAPGCNAPGVAQYVMASVLAFAGTREISNLTMGVVGAGHVGSIVARWACSLGMKVLVCDPPLERSGDTAWQYVTPGDIARECDVITFHTPLTATGPDATYHLAGERFFGSLRRRPIVINSARGPVTDTAALKEAIATGKVSHAVVDCWEGEPDIDRGLLAMCDIATPHIAGYSLQGKTRASLMAVDAVARVLGLGLHHNIMTPTAAPLAVTAAAVAASYDPMADTQLLKAAPQTFEQLRNGYNLRNEIN